jgi:predicted regulator of Ras-like GTPase activity (Roadblock/LC7/MglB family)
MTTPRTPECRAVREIELVLLQLLERASATVALLLDGKGRLLAHAGNLTTIEGDAAAGLWAAMLATQHQVARLVGGTGSLALSYEGTSHHLHAALVQLDVVLVVVFDQAQAMGRVRHEARRAGELLVPELERLPRPAPSDAADKVESPASKEFALNVLDKIFIGK